MATIERLATKAYRAESAVPYLDVFQLHSLYDKLVGEGNLILSGPKGIGKSVSFQAYAEQHDIPIITFDCSEDVRRSNLIGRFVMRGDQTPFVLGPLPTAFEIANEVGQCMLVCEEINALTPQMQKVLNSSCDFRKRIEVPECLRVFKLNPGCKLWICGTMNTTTYGGVYRLNEDLKSRFRILQLSYPKADEETAILEHVMGPDIDPEKVLRLATETRTAALEYSLSTRDVVQILSDMKKMGPKKALLLAAGKFETDSDRQTFHKRVRSIFSVRLR